MDAIKCKTCDRGTLVKRKKYRMSGIVVLIGYILVIPSVLGILIGVAGIVGSGSAGTSSNQASRTRVEADLRAASVPSAVIAKVTKNPARSIAVSDTAALNGMQRAAIRSASLSLAASDVGTTVGVGLFAGFSIFVVIASLVGGLLGYLLIMKKSVLQCDTCGATVATG
ncbi:MAG: hypothetical protein DMD45_10270 [Gemmatimonadetes bacterium]|nr:MAG: hypothetical protein DMD45_10270 [Gemmatimonadota bacterium]